MLRLAALAALVALAACYRPAATESCAVQCGPGGECPSGLACFGGLCRSSSNDTCANVVPTDSKGPADAIGDGSNALTDACRTFGSGLFTIVDCRPMLPPQLTLMAAFNTVGDCSGPNFQHVFVPGGQVCLATATQILVPGALFVSGPYPLVLVSDDINIAGSITSSAGAGLGCATSPSGTMGGGGAGGTAGTQGGYGGTGTGLQAMSSGTTAIASIRGGCPGGYGDSAVVGSSGDPGGGGGVIYLIGTKIELGDNAELSAPGLGGGGGSSGGNGGGGGAGAGGLIAIDTDALTLGANVVLCAQGGGGGGGGSKQGSTNTGSTGFSGCALFPGAATGGPGATGEGGAGGNGASNSGVARPGDAAVVATSGAGGGGGGVGWILAYGTASATLVGAATDPPVQ